MLNFTVPSLIPRIALAAFALGAANLRLAGGPSDWHVIANDFIEPAPPVPEVHASTIVQAADGARLLGMVAGASAAWSESAVPEVEASALRARFLAQIERPRVPAAVKIITRQHDAEFRIERFSMMTEPGQRLEAVLYAPANQRGRRPAVVLLHNTSKSKEAMVPFAFAFARRGAIAVALDARGYGRNASAEGGRATYLDTLVLACKDGMGQPFLMDPVWDALRLVDYLQTRDDIDVDRIGLLGYSKGGMEGLLVAAVDERIRAVAPLIGVQSFRYGLENDAWQARAGSLQPAVERAAAIEGGREVDARFMRRFLDRVAPNLIAYYDGPAMLPLIAPRPLLVVAGDTDARNPLPGVMLCAEAARAAYARQEAEDKFELLVQKDTGHAVRPEARKRAVEWMMENL